MTGERITETHEGIQDEFTVEVYDRFLKRMRDKGWMETDQIIKSGINQGSALEIGPGPGYLGLEWLKKTEGTRLTGLEISSNMIEVAEKNAREYNLEARIDYIEGDAQKMPLDDNLFDGVFANGSLHEWSNPEEIFNEIHRVLKPGGLYFISDLRRDISPFIKWFMKVITKPRELRPGLVTSFNAAYIIDEVKSILKDTDLTNYEVSKNTMGLTIVGSSSRTGSQE